MASINVETKKASNGTVLKGTYDVKQTNTTFYDHSGIKQSISWTLKVGNRGDSISPQGKLFYRSNTFGYTRGVTK